MSRVPEPGELYVQHIAEGGRKGSGFSRYLTSGHGQRELVEHVRRRLWMPVLESDVRRRMTRESLPDVAIAVPVDSADRKAEIRKSGLAPLRKLDGKGRSLELLPGDLPGLIVQDVAQRPRFRVVYDESNKGKLSPGGVYLVERQKGHISLRHLVKNGLILVQKPGKCGVFQFPLQPPEPDLIYGKTYRRRNKKEQKYHDTLAAQQMAPPVIIA